MRFKKRILLWVLAGIAGAMPLYAAEDTASAAKPPASETLERLRRLKQENPQEFQRLIQERKTQIKSKVQEFQQKNPEKFEGFRKQVSENRMHRLRKMKQENPESFHRDMQGRAQRFEKLKQENPERVQKFMEKHPRFNERVNKAAFHRGAQQSGRGEFQGRPHQTGNFQERKKEGAAQERRQGNGEFQNRPAPQNASQFVSRPEARENFTEGAAPRGQNFPRNNPGANGQNQPRFNPTQNSQSSGPFQNPGYNKPFEGNNRPVQPGRDFQRTGSGAPANAQSFRPQAREVKRDRAPQQEFGGARRPSQGGSSLGGGPGGGPRRRDR